MAVTERQVQKTVLLTGETVSTKFYQKLQDHIRQFSDSVVVGTICIAEKMCEQRFWSYELFTQDHNLAGRCIKDMAARSLIPYEFVDRRSDNKCTYRRI